MSWKTSAVAGKLHWAMEDFVLRMGLGIVSGSENTLEIFDRPDHFRRADISFTSTGRFPDDLPESGGQRLAPDLVVEVVSPNDSLYEVERKVREYLDYGVALVWVVRPVSRSVEVIRAGQRPRILGPDDTLDGEDILPGFTYVVAHIFEVRSQP